METVDRLQSEIVAVSVELENTSKLKIQQVINSSRFFYRLEGKSRRKLFLFSLKDPLQRRRLYFKKSITSIKVELLLVEKRAYYVVLRTRLPFFNRDKRQNLVATKMLKGKRDILTDFCETLISISKSRLSRKTLVSFSISTLNFVVRSLILILNSHSQTLKNLRNLN